MLTIQLGRRDHDQYYLFIHGEVKKLRQGDSYVQEIDRLKE